MSAIGALAAVMRAKASRIAAANAAGATGQRMSADALRTGAEVPVLRFVASIMSAIGVIPAIGSFEKAPSE